MIQEAVVQNDPFLHHRKHVVPAHNLIILCLQGLPQGLGNPFQPIAFHPHQYVGHPLVHLQHLLERRQGHQCQTTIYAHFSAADKAGQFELFGYQFPESVITYQYQTVAQFDLQVVRGSRAQDDGISITGPEESALVDFSGKMGDQGLPLGIQADQDYACRYLFRRGEGKGLQAGAPMFHTQGLQQINDLPRRFDMPFQFRMFEKA